MAPKRKLQKRIKALGAQVEESIREDGEDHKFKAAESAQLFQVDSKGGADHVLTKKQKLMQKDPMVKSRKFDGGKASKLEVERLKKMKLLQEQQQEQQKPIVEVKSTTTTSASLKVWGNDGKVAEPAELALLDPYIVPAVVKKVRRRKLIASTGHKIAKVQVAAPGQSYHPEFAAHQDVMAEAVAKELERRDVRAEMAKPVTAGMSEETLQYIDMRGSDEESDSDEDESGDEASGARKKTPGVITRSQRNKRSRHKQMELEHSQRRQEKAIIKQINAANHILQDIIRDEKSSEQKVELKKVLEEQKLEQEPELVRVGGKLVKVVRETAVAFSEELTGNMRTLKPKGSLLLERFDSLHKRNMIQINGPKRTHKAKVKIIETKKTAAIYSRACGSDAEEPRGGDGARAVLAVLGCALAAEAFDECQDTMGSLMRPNNFRHDKRGSRVVEIRMEEYERSKRSILKKIRFRLLVLGVLMFLLAIVAITLGIVIRSYHMKIVKFHRLSIGVRLRDLYFIYAAVAIVFSFHGFYMDGNWSRMQLDGNRLVMHVRLYSLLGVGAWAVALWLGAATLSAFGLVEAAYITQSSPNLIYLSTLVTVCTHMLVAPWLLRTIHRKGSQADEYFGAEFMADMKRPQRVAPRRASSEDEDEENRGDGSDDDDDDSAQVAPATSPSRRGSGGSSRIKSRKGEGQKSRKAFYNADGTATVAMPAAVATSPSSPRGSAVASPPQPPLHASDGGFYGTAVAQEELLTSSHAEQIPFASPVFVMDREAHLEPSEFWRLWKQVETTGSFSCIFKNQPTKREVEAHLRAFGFHVVSCDAKDNVLQAYFFAHQLGAADVFFLCEFVLIYSRRFFQATFKCKEREAAADFVTRFNLQELLVVESD